MHARPIFTGIALGATLLMGGATAAQATPPPSETRAMTAQTAQATAEATSVTPMAGCASLVRNAPGSAQIKNICNYQIQASVDVDGWFNDPSCITVNAGATRNIYWDAGNGRANYAYEC
ncbi:hypothetical protein [Streptomyces jumonjinensis]|uniref:hypothetical protein n=1 Tax=Streptomyces jumonjinensis TaxID=1945 RepID=UPI00378E4FF5